MHAALLEANLGLVDPKLVADTAHEPWGDLLVARNDARPIRGTAPFCMVATLADLSTALSAQMALKDLSLHSGDVKRQKLVVAA